LLEVCTRCAERGWLRVLALSAGDKVVASSLNFLLHGRWSGYMKGFDPEWSSMRPGTVLDALRIKTAIEEGASFFDFGRGHEEYKSGYGIEIERNTRVLIASSSVSSIVAYALLMAHIRRRSRLMGADPDVPTTTQE
jgi:CelD/BcsL family acetyltransferase involved in cellulose biosynthesis